LQVDTQILAVDGFNIGPIAPQVALVPPESCKKFGFRKPPLTLARRILGDWFAFFGASLYAIGAGLVPIAPYFPLLA
jgi:hypothetical protein